VPSLPRPIRCQTEARSSSSAPQCHWPSTQPQLLADCVIRRSAPRERTSRSSAASPRPGAIAISGLCTWVLSVPEVSASLVATRVLYFMSFLFGGVGFAVVFGLLAAGVSVTSHFARLLPRWLVVLGMIVAVAGELSFLSLIAYPVNLAIPVTRFVGFAWLVLVGGRLPETLRRTEAASPEGAPA